MVTTTIIRVPCSSANIGPGFDVLGLALSLWLELKVTISDSHSTGAPHNCRISFQGLGGKSVSLNPSQNIITQTALYVLRCHQQHAFPANTHVHIINSIPLGRGLGSSGAAVVAGVALGNEVGKLGLSKDRLLDFCLMIERHPDNVAAALYGGFVGSSLRELNPEDPNRREVPLLEVLPAVQGDEDLASKPPVPPLNISKHILFPWAKEIKCLAIIPDFRIATAKARRVLPTSYMKADTIYNLQRVTLLTAAVGQSPPNPELIYDSMQDKIHQPYRQDLIPGLTEILQSVTPATHPGLLGICLSGAGPTVLALATRNFEQIAEHLVQQFQRKNISCDWKLLEPAYDGLTVSQEAAPQVAIGSRTYTDAGLSKNAGSEQPVPSAAPISDRVLRYDWSDSMAARSASQSYLSTRGGSYDFSFEEVVLKGLADDGGLFIPEDIPSLPVDFLSQWRDYSFEELAFEIFSLYISREEIPADDLKDIIKRSYETFRARDITPIITLDHDKKVHLLELFHGPTFAFKDVALQFVGNLFEYFLVRRNQSKGSTAREHLTVIGATSGDTGSAAIYGLRGKEDVSLFIMYPKGKVSPIQEAQMTTVTDANVHNLSVEGTFDDCQDILKTLFADKETNSTLRLAAVNSINWARILAQITYYFHSYFSVARRTGEKKPDVRFVVPTGNFGDILAGFFATRMGLPTKKLVIATNENDILHRFWRTGHYEKQPKSGPETEGGIAEDGAKADPSGVKQTHAPAMDILVSSNFERLLWYLAFQTSDVEDPSRRRMQAGETVRGYMSKLKTSGGFSVAKEILAAANENFESERVNDKQTIETIKQVYSWSLPRAKQSNGHADGVAVLTKGTETDGHYILDPHSAIGVAATLRSIESNAGCHHISLATAHPAKFAHAVGLALKERPGFSFATVFPDQFVGLEDLPKRITHSKADWKQVREIVIREVEEELGLATVVSRRLACDLQMDRSSPA